ncbi:ankyrin repeat domain-containing protein [Wolbachia endosymbiont of Mansonella perstans]|nr:ankyrin repeat domain-containing protein [Wolbachia endosymbiont of Mansonella perstans]
MVKHLTKSGMGIEITDQGGLTPLHIVAACNSAKSIKYLLENEANLEARDNGGYTPLFFVESRHNSKIIELLQEKTKSKKDLDRDVLKETKSQHSQTSEVSLENEVSLEKAEKRQPCFLKIASVNLAAMLVVLSIVSAYLFFQ